MRKPPFRMRKPSLQMRKTFFTPLKPFLLISVNAGAMFFRIDLLLTYRFHPSSTSPPT
jgi:hypothetical protein